MVKTPASPDLTPAIRTFAVNFGHYTEFKPSKRQPISGGRKLWARLQRLMQATAVLQSVWT